MKTAGSFVAMRAALLAAILLAAAAGRGQAASTPLQVAYAGSMGSLMDGAVRPAIARALGADLEGRAQGSTGLARLIAAGSIRPDVFIAVTPGPMRLVIAAGKADRAVPIARTEMVIAYSPKSRFAAEFAQASGAADAQWRRILERPGVRFGRTDPNADPLGLNIIFTMQLAAGYYHEPDLPDRILGEMLNPQQIFLEPQLMARLQAGQLDASAAYRTQPGSFGLPYLALPAEINLGSAALEAAYAKATVTLNGKTLHPAPLIFYAAVMKDAAQPALARRFVEWLQGEAARAIFAKYDYDAADGAPPLAP